MREEFVDHFNRRVFPSYDDCQYDSERYRNNSIHNFRQMNTSIDLSNVLTSSHTSTSISTSIPKIRCKFIVAMEAAVMHINNLPSEEDFREKDKTENPLSVIDIP